MSNSNLISYQRKSANCSHVRKRTIDTIVINAIEDHGTKEIISQKFLAKDCKQAYHYIIDEYGEIANLVDETDSANTTSNKANDARSITIAVAGFENGIVSEKASSALARLCTDICLRNNIDELRFIGDTKAIGQINKQNVINYCWFDKKGSENKEAIDKLINNLIINTNNLIQLKKELKSDDSYKGRIEVGDTLKIKEGAVYNDGTAVPLWIVNSTLYVKEIENNNIMVSTRANGKIQGAINRSQIKSVINNSKPVSIMKIQLKNEVANIHEGPAFSYDLLGIIRNNQIYAITEVEGNWGKVDSKGWINLSNATVVK